MYLLHLAWWGHVTENGMMFRQPWDWQACVRLTTGPVMWPPAAPPDFLGLSCRMYPGQNPPRSTTGRMVVQKDGILDFLSCKFDHVTPRALSLCPCCWESWRQGESRLRPGTRPPAFWACCDPSRGFNSVSKAVLSREACLLSPVHREVNLP